MCGGGDGSTVFLVAPLLRSSGAVLSLSVETPPLIILTHDPDELRAALVGDVHKDNIPREGGREFLIPTS